MIAVIRTDSGSYNLFGTSGDAFILEGNLTEAQLKELRKAIDKALKEGRS